MSIFTTQLTKYKRSSLRIVYYHVISDENPEYYFPNKALSVQKFRDHIKFFKKNYQIISLEEARSLAMENQSLDKKLVITFDDGFKENYTTIAPILDEEDISATFFIITNCMDNNDLMWRNKILLFEKYKPNNLESIQKEIVKEFDLIEPIQNQNFLEWSFQNWPMDQKEAIVNRFWEKIMPFSLKDYLERARPYCTIDQIKELSNRGFGIGSHSHTHPVFSKLDYDGFSSELRKSEEMLNEILDKKVDTFSYPFGNRADAAIESKFQQENNLNWTYLGTKNRLQNYTDNYQSWERDNIEFSNLKMKLRFLYLPIYRNLFSSL